MTQLRIKFSEAFKARDSSACIKILYQVDASHLFDFVQRLTNDEQEFVFNEIILLKKHFSTNLLVLIFENGLRTNSMELFRILTYGSSFAAENLTDASFNQMVLKAIFNNLDVKRIPKITTRLNKLLLNQLNDYKQERLSANRGLQPSLVWLLEQFNLNRAQHAENL